VSGQIHTFVALTRERILQCLLNRLHELQNQSKMVKRKALAFVGNRVVNRKYCITKSFYGYTFHFTFCMATICMLILFSKNSCVCDREHEKGKLH
jgi:hypothetical protein